MKSTTILACLALASCSAFTASKDPVTGIRRDAPAEWQGTPNPLDSPTDATAPRPASEGNFGHEWLWR